MPVIALSSDVSSDLAKLSRRAFLSDGSSWTAEDLAAFAGRPGCAVLADADLSCGLILVQAAADEAEVVNLGVVPAKRRRHIGSGLLTEAEEYAARRGALRMFLEVAADNVPALALYARAGFARIGTRSSYYRRPGGDRIDALLLSKEIAP